MGIFFVGGKKDVKHVPTKEESSSSCSREFEAVESDFFSATGQVSKQTLWLWESFLCLPAFLAASASLKIISYDIAMSAMTTGSQQRSLIFLAC